MTVEITSMAKYTYIHKFLKGLHTVLFMLIKVILQSYSHVMSQAFEILKKTGTNC